MADSFDCPKCGAPIKPDSAEPTMTCPYCGETIAVPKNMRRQPPASQDDDVDPEALKILEELDHDETNYKAKIVRQDKFNTSFNAWFKWFFMLIGVICLALGVKNFFDEKALMATYEPATANLELHQKGPSKNNSELSYCSYYNYTRKDGTTGLYSTDNCSNNPDIHSFGAQQVLVYYNPMNHEADIIDTGWLGNEYDGLITGIIGFVFFGLIWAIWAVAEWASARAKH